jgi:hypothetical protein
MIELNKPNFSLPDYSTDTAAFLNSTLANKVFQTYHNAHVILGEAKGENEHKEESTSHTDLNKY